MKKEFFNLRASDKVSLWRSIPDSRDPLYVEQKQKILVKQFSLDAKLSTIPKISQQHQ